MRLRDDPRAFAICRCPEWPKYRPYGDETRLRSHSFRPCRKLASSVSISLVANMPDAAGCCRLNS